MIYSILTSSKFCLYLQIHQQNFEIIQHTWFICTKLKWLLHEQNRDSYLLGGLVSVCHLVACKQFKTRHMPGYLKLLFTVCVCMCMCMCVCVCGYFKTVATDWDRDKIVAY